MLITEGQKSLLVEGKTKLALYHVVPAFVLDSLSKIMNGLAMDVMLSNANDRREGWAKYPLNTLIEIDEMKKSYPDSKLIAIAGKSGTGKTYSISKLFIDEVNQCRLVSPIKIKAKNEIKEVDAIHNVFYFNSENKPVTFPGYNLFFRNNDLSKPEVGYYPNYEPNSEETPKGWIGYMHSIMNIVQMQGTPPIFIDDPYMPNVCHAYYWETTPTIILLAHLVDEPIYRNSNEKNPIKIGEKQKINFYGNSIYKLDFEGNFNYVVYSTFKNGEYCFDLRRTETNTIRMIQPLELKQDPIYSMNNDMRALLTLIQKSSNFANNFYL